ncbi:hypothetical protein WUBG_18897 [Wuchereria bancrofti]|uniref:Uncharacterized protein n=1 Tax=Wuchereria bancrofti TaxID=6293 RepID=J9A8E5_WUCBA|nr:hypothetical protein WUBG_18897 [Wuchereria bancrofti]
MFRWNVEVFRTSSFITLNPKADDLYASPFMKISLYYLERTKDEPVQTSKSKTLQYLVKATKKE